MLQDLFKIIADDQTGQAMAFAITTSVLILSIPILAIVFGAIHNMVIATTRQREQTTRELAAYVAEGSLSPEDAERLLAAGSASIKRIRAHQKAMNIRLKGMA